MRLIASASASALHQALEGRRSATVEAEFGDIVVEGSVLTLAHHGPRAGNPAPCLRENDVVDVEVVGLSHLDLDSLGGVLSLTGEKPGPRAFWELAAHVDVHGPHRGPDHPAWAAHSLHLHAFWAWGRSRRVQIPREGVLDVGEWISEGREALVKILADDPALLAQGEALVKGSRDDEAAAWIEDRMVLDRVIRVFAGPAFGNAWYRTSSGQVAEAVVWYNTRTGEINLSFERGSDSPIHAAEVMKDLFGPLAGGHRGIAGGPRGVRLGLQGLSQVVERAVAELTKLG